MAEYRTTVKSHLVLMGGALTDVGKLLAQAAANPVLLGDPDWDAGITATLWTVELYVDLIEDLSEPALLEDAHVHLLDGVADYRRFVDLTLRGIETEDLETVATEAAQTLEQGYEDLLLANSLRYPVCGEHMLRRQP